MLYQRVSSCSLAKAVMLPQRLQQGLWPAVYRPTVLPKYRRYAHESPADCLGKANGSQAHSKIA
jgi:hypothetical protein